MPNPLKLILFSHLFAFLPQTGWSISSLGWNDAVLFYRAPNSTFPSGQASLRDLERSERKSDLDFVYRVHWNQKVYLANANQILRDIQTSTWLRTKSMTALYESPQLNSTKLTTLAPNTSLRIVNVLNHWASVYDGHMIGWIPFHHTNTVREDPGLFVPLIDTYIRSLPQQGAPILSTAAKGSRWIPQQIMEDWLEVQWEGQRAYLDLAHLAHRIDFSSWAYHRTQGWIRLGSRSSGTIISDSQEKFWLKDFSAFEIDPKKALMTDSMTNGPQLRSRVTLESISAVRWVMSSIDGHGDVWWKREIFKEPPVRNLEKEHLSFEDILKKDLFSLSFVSGNSLRGQKNSSGISQRSSPISGLASSHGVFKTKDGQRWDRINEFGDENLPVCIHPDGIWFVGSFRSFDQGQTFEPFLRWDLLAEIIQNELKRPALYLKLSRIIALKGSQLEIVIETGFRPVHLRGHTLGQFWNISK